LISLAPFAFAQEIPVEVTAVRFNTLPSNGTVHMQVGIHANGNTAADAKNERFVDNIKAMVYLTYETGSSDQPFDYYKSEVKIMSIERDVDKKIHFFLPGVIVKRDRLPRAPNYYVVRFEINGRSLNPSSAAYTETLRPDQLQSMLRKADAEGGPNDFILMPHNEVSQKLLDEARVDESELAPLFKFRPKE